MTYLFKPYDGEVKNDDGNPLPISKDTNNNASGNPIYVEVTNPVTSVDIGTMPEVEIKNDVDNPIPISKNVYANSNENPIFVQGTSDTSFFDPTQSDAFGRLRVSNPFTLFESFHRYQDNGKVSSYSSGTASTTHDPNSSSLNLTIGTANGDTIIRESSRVFAYQPGKSLQILTTFCMSPDKTNLRQRIGFFDVNNGIYLERSNGTAYFVLRSSSANGTPVERREAKVNWNINTFPDLDLDRVQILWFDIEWLGVGSVRCGFVYNGEFVHCHTFHNANTEISENIPLTTTYMGTACLPVRLEITNTGATVSPSTYKQICTSVISEGGFELRGRPKSIGHALNAARTLSAINTVFPIMSIRLKAGRDGAVVLPKNFSFAPLTSANYRWQLIQGVTSGGTWVDAGSDSSVEYNLTATSVTTTTLVFEQGYVLATNQSVAAPSLQDLPFKYQLERNTLSTPKTYFEFILVVSTTAQNPDVVSSINWEEYT